MMSGERNRAVAVFGIFLAVFGIFIVIVTLTARLVSKEKRPVVEEDIPGTVGAIAQPPEFVAKPVISPRLAEIINTSKNRSTKNEENYALLNKIQQETGAKCAARGVNCYGFFARLLEESEIVIALKTITEAGVTIYVWPTIDGRERIYIDDNGLLIIGDKTEAGQLKQFLGIKKE